jgi:hypothetical protein
LRLALPQPNWERSVAVGRSVVRTVLVPLVSFIVGVSMDVAKPPIREFAGELVAQDLPLGVESVADIHDAKAVTFTVTITAESAGRDIAFCISAPANVTSLSTVRFVDLTQQHLMGAEVTRLADGRSDCFDVRHMGKGAELVLQYDGKIDNHAETANEAPRLTVRPGAGIAVRPAAAGRPEVPSFSSRFVVMTSTFALPASFGPVSSVRPERVTASLAPAKADAGTIVIDDVPFAATAFDVGPETARDPGDDRQEHQPADDPHLSRADVDGTDASPDEGAATASGRTAYALGDLWLKVLRDGGARLRFENVQSGLNGAGSDPTVRPMLVDVLRGRLGITSTVERQGERPLITYAVIAP